MDGRCDHQGLENIKGTDSVIDVSRFHLMTHNLTHNGKRAGGGNGVESTVTPNFTE